MWEDWRQTYSFETLKMSWSTFLPVITSFKGCRRTHGLEKVKNAMINVSAELYVPLEDAIHCFLGDQSAG